MLMIRVDGRPPGSTIRMAGDVKPSCKITGTVAGAGPLRPIEIVVNGEVVQRIPPANRRTAHGGYESPIEAEVALQGSSWIALRVFEDRPDARVRFAHSSPVHVDVPGKPLRPRRAEVEYMIGRMKEEVQRNRDVLRPESLEEYREALRAYENMAATAR